MIALPHELLAAHIVFDEANETATSAPARRLSPTRYAARGRSPAREAQRAAVRRRFLAGWASLNPAIAPILRRGR